MPRPRAATRIIEHPDVSQVNLQQVLEALVDPVRRGVVTQLAQAGQELSCGTFDVPVSVSTLTHHFNVLREAAVIRQYYVGTTKMNALRLEEMESRFPGLLPAVLAAAPTESQLAPGDAGKGSR